MRKWMPLSFSVSTRSRQLGARLLSTAVRGVERVSIRCGSSGNVNIDLYNAELSSSDTLMLYLPPCSITSADEAFQPPSFCLRYPTAVINYRWSGFSPFRIPATPFPSSSKKYEEYQNNYMGWPTPIHDVLNAYNWILENLQPPEHTRRAIYVYGSYLGASLAASLALTESYLNKAMTIRGCIAYNGIYNWTKCLPDHPVNKRIYIKETPYGNQEVIEFLPQTPSRDVDFHIIEQNIERLFGDPQHLFDPLASPNLFFHTPGLLAPPSFNASATSVPSLSKLYPHLNDKTLKSLGAIMNRTQIKGLAYPPRDEPREIPEMLLLHTEPPRLRFPRIMRRRIRNVGRNFKDQAEKFAKSIRIRIIVQPGEKYPEGEYPEGEYSEGEYLTGEDLEGNEEEVVEDITLGGGPVQVHRVGINPEMGELRDEGARLAATWLEESIDKLYWSYPAEEIVEEE